MVPPPWEIVAQARDEVKRREKAVMRRLMLEENSSAETSPQRTRAKVFRRGLASPADSARVAEPGMEA